MKAPVILRLFQLLALVITSGSSALGQDSPASYFRIVELRATVDALGNIYVSPPEFHRNKQDTLLIEVKEAIEKSTDPKVLLNILAIRDWELISVTQVVRNQDGNPANPFLLYYIRKSVSLEGSGNH